MRILEIRKEVFEMEEGRGTLVARVWWCTVYTACSVAPLKSLKLPAISPGSRHFTMGGVEEKGEEDHFKSALPEVGREDGGPGSAGTQTQEKAAPCLVSAPSPQGRSGCHAETSLG